jgi:hypothetical protein
VIDRILEATVEALNTVAEPRFFRTERGYHGRFYCMLQAALDRRGLLDDGAILEMEYQKSERHKLNQRPDIIFHVPAEESGASVTANNFAVFALKWRASRAEAMEDFRKLDEICDRLGYPLAIFINVASERTHREHYAGQYDSRLRTFGVVLENGTPRVVQA